MEYLSQIWATIINLIGGLSIGGCISAVIYGCLKGGFNKTISKLNVEKIEEKAVEKGVEKVKKITFKHDIQPIVLSEVKKVNEEAVKGLKDELKNLKDQYNNLIEVLKCFSSYFESSIIPEEKKQALADAISKAENKTQEVESVVVEELAEETETSENNGNNEATQSIER